MISLNRPPFGISAVVASALANGKRNHVQQFEAAYAAAAGCFYAVWLPTARAGICWALRASVGERTTVVGPAFTCSAVHEAMVRSGGRIHLVDAEDDGFLMSEEALLPLQGGNYAMVLSEVYGHTYDLARLERRAASPPAVRIVDMAMAVPHPALFERLHANDFAVISFGRGKSMFAGSGAVGFTRNQALANEVRNQRDAILLRGGFRLLLQRAAKVSLRTLAQYPAVYPLARRLQSWVPAEEFPEMPAIGFPPAWSNDGTLALNWKLPSTRLDRGLALRNLDRADYFRQARLALARRYHTNLDEANGILRPKISPEALSHYTVRVSPAIRPLAHERLHLSGSLWAFCHYLDKSLFPNAFRLSCSVLNLPLSPWMSLHQVDRVCEVLRRCVEDCANRASAESDLSIR
jgi:dTDP-4-amino-4,6-dideoxygalactose transaminase